MEVKTNILQQMSIVQLSDNQNVRSTRLAERFPVKEVIYLPSNHLLNQKRDRKMPAAPSVDDSTISKDRHSINKSHRFLQSVGDVNDGNASIAEFANDPEQVSRFFEGQRGIRFVQDEHSQVCGEGFGYFDQLSLSKAQ